MAARSPLRHDGGISRAILGELDIGSRSSGPRPMKPAYP
jgi:hypothetical protein